MAHLHTIYDSDLHFVIDPATRVITNQSENKNSVIQFDHNSERFTFELPRYIEEHDMLECNRVEVHYVNIDSKTGNQASGVYEVQDLQVSPHDDKVAICSWLVSSNATQYAGSLSFVLRFACTRGEVVDYVWNTAVFKNYSVQGGLYNSDPIVSRYADVLAQWYDSLFTASADGVTNIQEARAAAITAVDVVADERIADVEQAGRDVIGSLPEDYVALAENVAPPILETATGAAIAITDSANRKLRGLNLYGKSTQDGTPTPEAPVEIESVVEPTVRVCGKNLLEIVAETQTVNGVTFTVNENGTVIVNGTATADTFFEVNRSVAGVLNNTSYCLSGCPAGGSAETYFLRASDRLTKAYDDFGEGRAFSYPDVSQFVVSIRVMSGATVSNLLFAPMVRLAEIEDDSYESYKKIQTLPVARTLPGIPVASGGNYTDENGQQWICDEVDFERGVYVQRLKEDTLNGTKGWAVSNNEFYVSSEAPSTSDGDVVQCVSSHYPAFSRYEISRNATEPGFVGISIRDSWIRLVDNTNFNGDLDALNSWFQTNSVTLVYRLATPIETALTAEELAAYASLRSNYPNTTVLNDGGAGMAVSYVADTKLYIDKKLSV